MNLINIQNLQDLSDIIKWHRKRCHLTQQALADMAQVGRASIQRMEKGESFEFSTLLKVMDILNLKIGITGPLIDVYQKREGV